jgi:hypothetical protein
MDIRVSKVKNNDGSVEVYFNDVGHWDYLDPIKNILINENQCVVIGENYMVTDKDVFMRFKNIEFTLAHNYMFGNYLLTKDDRVIPILEQLAQNVIDSIEQKLIAKGLL